MKACPVTFSHPSEAIQLNGFGPKTCADLTEKLKAHCAANGLPTPKKPSAKNRKRVSGDDLADVEEPAPPKRPRRIKPYVPGRRTGAYAIVLALSSVPEDSLQSLTKTQVIELAQPHCDSDFTEPDPGKYYTAWNSINTLVNKDLVQERGRPLRKYALTEEGWDVAKRIRQVEAREEGDISEHVATERITSSTIEQRSKIGEIASKRKNVTSSSGQRINPAQNRTTYAGFDDLNGEDSSDWERWPSVEGHHEFGPKVKSTAPTHMREHKTARSWATHALGDFDEENFEEVDRFSFSPLHTQPSASTSQSPQRSSGDQQLGYRLGGAPTDKFGTFDPAARVREARKPKFKPPPNIVEILSSPEPVEKRSGSSKDARALRAISGNHPPPSARHKTTSLKPKSFTDSNASIKTNILPKDPPRPVPTTTNITNTTTISPALPTFTPITLPPGSFTVRLILDNREVKSKASRDGIQKSLQDRGIDPLVRPLPLGDIFWVAELHSPLTHLAPFNHGGDDPATAEIALDYIVERKRLDDLVGSITDGRFSEQKHRLRRSGVQNVIYLIEEVALSPEKQQRFAEAISSAIASTQVVNGFFVKQTRCLDESIKYLVRMTHLLKSRYEGKPLQVIPTRALDSATYLPLLKQLKLRGECNNNITFPAFASMASKSEGLTLRDVYLKMLMCTRGISGEKAMAIQKHWRTPQEFIRAFEEAGAGTGAGGGGGGGRGGAKESTDATRKKARDTLVESKLGGSMVGKTKIKGALSRKVAEIWGDS
ncbi:MAG: Crossover junction endonuclease mus81 [Ramalina farinacea]|uniref:Crossover junction endonuclease MUS81 n=1 Tax=Ramalina farinacea TaxID=258253 RepID=A0AA43QTJ5_9LECA|nr:Crossover junction endonuclease mus81 [Ramalina farinacea]